MCAIIRIVEVRSLPERLAIYDQTQERPQSKGREVQAGVNRIFICYLNREEARSLPQGDNKYK